MERAEALRGGAFWLRQPEHFFVPVQIALYKKYGKALDPDPEALRSWMDGEARATTRRLEDAAAGAGRRAPTRRPRAGDARSRAHAGGGLLARARQRPRPPRTCDHRVPPGPHPGGLGRRLPGGRRPARPAGRPPRPPARPISDAALAEWMTDAVRGAGALLARVAVNRLWQHHFGTAWSARPTTSGPPASRPTIPSSSSGSPAGSSPTAGGSSRPTAGSSRAPPIGGPSPPNRRGPGPTPKAACSRGGGPSAWRPRRSATRCSRPPAGCDRGCTGRRSARRSPPRRSPPGARIAYPADVADGPGTWRRSVYAFTKRSVSNPFAEVFDAPDLTAACGRRNATTVPTQALALLNDPFVSRVRPRPRPPPRPPGRSGRRRSRPAGLRTASSAARRAPEELAAAGAVPGPPGGPRRIAGRLLSRAVHPE